MHIYSPLYFLETILRINTDMKKLVIEQIYNKIYLLIFIVNVVIVLLLDIKWAVDVYIYDKNHYSIFNKLLSMRSDTAIANVYYWIFPHLAASPSILNGNKHEINGDCSSLKIKRRIVSIISGFSLIFSPLVIDFWLQSMTAPSTYPMPDDMTTLYHSPMFCSELYFSNPRMFVLLWITIMSIYGGAFACLGFTITEFIKNRLLSYVALTIIWVGNYIISLFFDGIPWKILLCAGNDYGYNSSKLIVSNLLNIISIVTLIVIIGSKKEKRDEKKYNLLSN